MNFEINLLFLIKPHFLHDQKVKAKIEISWERKMVLGWNKAFFIIFKELWLKQIKQIFLESESPTLSC